MKKITFRPDVSSFGLHLLAMALMLCDHLWATLVPGSLWLTALGRMAYPIFAFMIAEGWRRTADRKKYMLRLLVFALAAELPFNLMYMGSWIFPFHQNVLWTFLWALLCMQCIDGLQRKWSPKPVTALLFWPAALALAALFALAAQLTMTDYYGAGVLTVLVFCAFRGGKWWQRLGQLAGLIYINWHLISGMTLPLQLGSLSLELPLQGAAVLALIPIWCYRGRQGPHSKGLQLAMYAFYPVHMLQLGLAVRYL